MSIVLKGLTWDHPRGYQPLKLCSDVYEKEFGVRINWHKRSLKDFGDQSLELLSKEFDLLIIDHPHVGFAEKRRFLKPLNDIIPAAELSQLRKQSAGPSYESYHYRDKQWALPVDAAVQSSAFRPDLLFEKNIPSSWDEVFRLGEFLKKKNLYLGISLSPTDCLCSFLTLTAQEGSPIIVESEFVNLEAGLKVLNKLKKIKALFHPSCMSWTPIDLFEYMSSNDDVVYTPLAFCYNNYSRDNFRKKKLKFHNVPGISGSVLGGAGIAISASCKHKLIAGEFITWICGSEIQKTIYMEGQGQPGNFLAWNDINVNKGSDNFFYNIYKTVENAYVRPRYNGWPEFQTKLGIIIHDFLKYDRNPIETLKQLATLFQQSKE